MEITTLSKLIPRNHSYKEVFLNVIKDENKINNKFKDNITFYIYNEKCIILIEGELIRNIKNKMHNNKRFYDLYLNYIDSNDLKKNTFYQLSFDFYNTDKNIGEHRYFYSLKYDTHYKSIREINYWGVKVELSEMQKSISNHTWEREKKYVCKHSVLKFCVSEFPSCCGLALLNNFTKGKAEFKKVLKYSNKLISYEKFTKLIWIDSHRDYLNDKQVTGGFKEIDSFKNKRSNNNLKLFITK
jgi:hypothetical protein